MGWTSAPRRRVLGVRGVPPPFRVLGLRAVPPPFRVLGVRGVPQPFRGVRAEVEAISRASAVLPRAWCRGGVGVLMGWVSAGVADRRSEYGV